MAPCSCPPNDSTNSNIIRQARIRMRDTRVNWSYSYYSRVTVVPNQYYNPTGKYTSLISKDLLYKKFIAETQRTFKWNLRYREHRKRFKNDFKTWLALHYPLFAKLPRGERMFYWGVSRFHKCHLWVFDVLTKAGIPAKDLIALNKDYWNARHLEKALKKNNRAFLGALGRHVHVHSKSCVYANPSCIKGGDIFIYPGHIGIVSSTMRNGKFNTIEYWNLNRIEEFSGRYWGDKYGRTNYIFFRVTK